MLLVSYFRFENGTYFETPMDQENKVHFVVQTDKLENFNDNIIIANASYIQAPIWGFKELHITRCSCIYEANAANTAVFQWIATGNNPTKYALLPMGCDTATVAGMTSVICAGEVDVPIHPSGALGTTSRLQFVLITITGVNAADDATLVFQGWYRGDPSANVERPTEPVAIKEIAVWPWKR